MVLLEQSRRTTYQKYKRVQYQTIFEYLGFDVVDKTELINNRKKKISNYPYIHLGRCIHVDVIKDFLREHNVKFNEQ